MIHARSLFGPKVEPVECYRSYQIELLDGTAYRVLDIPGFECWTLEAARAKVDQVVETLPLWCPVRRRIVDYGPGVVYRG